MTKEEIRRRLLKCLSIDDDDYTEGDTFGNYTDADFDIEACKEAIVEEFDVNLEDELTDDTTIEDVVDGLYEFFNQGK